MGQSMYRMTNQCFAPVKFFLRLVCGSRGHGSRDVEPHLHKPRSHGSGRSAAQQAEEDLQQEDSEGEEDRGEEDPKVAQEHPARSSAHPARQQVPWSPSSFLEAAGERPAFGHRALFAQRCACEARQPALLHCHQHQGQPWWSRLQVHLRCLLRTGEGQEGGPDPGEVLRHWGTQEGAATGEEGWPEEVGWAHRQGLGWGLHSLWMGYETLLFLSCAWQIMAFACFCILFQGHVCWYVLMQL